jgi:hypothetical protein
MSSIVLAVLILFFIAPVVSAHDDITGDGMFIDIMEEIGHDLEHIHEDMHTVAFAMKVIAVSIAAIAVFMFLSVIILFMLYRKKV